VSGAATTGSGCGRLEVGAADGALEVRTMCGEQTIATVSMASVDEARALVTRVVGAAIGLGLLGEDSASRVETAMSPIRRGTGADWGVEANCWRRGPGGSIAVYTLHPGKNWSRVYESEIETIDDRTARAVAESVITQLANELYPRLLDAVRATQGAAADERPPKGRLT